MSGEGEERAPGTSGSLGATAVSESAGSVGVDSHADTVAVTGEGLAASLEEPPSLIDSGGNSLDDLIGTTLQERYKISHKIGQGGMGAVYEATHLALGKKVAIKVLLDKYAAKDTVVARLEQEARLASSIGHDHIIDITDFGQTVTGRTFVVMEYLEGESLGACINREAPLSDARAIRICRQAASALGAAHDQGIIHRDVKPENVFLRRRGGKDSVKVVDFGISKTMRPDDGPDSSPRLTQTGMVLGTPLYMSPEQARGDDNPDHRVDIYALGVILYECVTGEVPFRGTNYLNIVSQVISVDPKTPRELRPEIPIELEEVILRALAKEPEDRYQTMEEFDADLAILQQEEGLGSTAARVTASRRRKRKRAGSAARIAKWGAAAAVVASLVVIAVMLASRSDSDEEPAATGAAVPAEIDAGEIANVADAARVTPAIEKAEVTITSKPSGATVYRGDEVLGPTPLVLPGLVKKDRPFEITLELDGYNYATGQVSPIEDDGKTKHYRLKKGKRKRPRPGKDTGKKPGSGSGSGGQGHQHGGGDLTPPTFP